LIKDMSLALSCRLSVTLRLTAPDIEPTTDNGQPVSVQPLLHVALQVERCSATPERPAHVCDRDEERRRQAIELADLAREQRGLAAEPHRSDARLIRFLDDARFERSQLGIGIRIVHRAQELFLRFAVSRAAIAADADAEDAGTAALALRVDDAIEDRVLDAAQIATAEVGMRERILRVHVLAAAALQHQLHFNVRLAPLMEVKDRRARPRVVAGVPAGHAVDAVLPQIPFLRRCSYRLGRRFFERELVISNRRVHIEEDRARVLTERQRAVARKDDVAPDDIERHVGIRALLLLRARARDGADDVIGKLRRRATDELENAFEEGGLGVDAFIDAMQRLSSHAVLRTDGESIATLTWSAAAAAAAFVCSYRTRT
jgi:hypothetical protein